MLSMVGMYVCSHDRVLLLGSCVTAISNWIFRFAVKSVSDLPFGWVYYFNWCQSLRYRIESFRMLTDFLLENSIHYTNSLSHTHTMSAHIFHVQSRQMRWNCGRFYSEWIRHTLFLSRLVSFLDKKSQTQSVCVCFIMGCRFANVKNMSKGLLSL